MRDSPVPLVTVPAFLAALRAGALPEGPRAELLAGRVSPGHTPTPTQMAVIAHLYAALSRPEVMEAGGLVVVNAAFRLGPGDLLRADLALLGAHGAGRDAGFATAGVGGSHDPHAAFVVVELVRGRATREERVPMYAAAGARELWLLDVARGWTEVLRSPWRGAYRSRTLWYPGEALRLDGLGGLEVVAMPAP